MRWGNLVRVARCDVFIGWRGPVFQGRRALLWISSSGWVVDGKGKEAQETSKRSCLCWRPFPPYPSAPLAICVPLLIPLLPPQSQQLVTTNPVPMSFLFSSPMLLTFVCLGRNSSPWLLIHLFSCARRLVKIFAYNKPFKILNNSEMYNSLLSCKWGNWGTQ